MQQRISLIGPGTRRLFSQYEKLLLRLQKTHSRGEWTRLSHRQKKQRTAPLKRYLKKLIKIVPDHRKIFLGICLLLSLSTPKIKGQTYVQPVGKSNVLGFVDVGTNSVPFFADIDADGDADVFVGNGDGMIQYFKNTGTDANPAFTHQTASANPLDGIDVGSNASPFFIDIDQDDDLDVLVGESSGTINFFRNDGSKTNPVFVEITGADNPFNGVDIGTRSVPNLVDIDQDGDPDAFIAGNNTTTQRGAIRFFRNDNGSFVPVLGTGNPFDGINTGLDPMLTFTDYDQDGDRDAFVGSQLGMIQYYQNRGTSSNPIYQLTTGTVNPFDGVDVGRNGALLPNPCFVDINADGNLDVFIGNLDGTINFFKCVPSPECSILSFRKDAGSDNPLNGIDVGHYSVPDFTDIDNDGDFDLFIADSLGRIQFFQNIGTPDQPQFLPNSMANPFQGIDIGSVATINFVDIDKDGDPDAFLGEAMGNIHFFQNNGSKGNPVYNEITGTANPFNGIDVGDQSSPVFADIDNDGDFDCFIGNKDGRLLFFQNNGTATSPAFVKIDDANNPFYGVDLEGKFVADLGDLDGDGDFDAIIGNKSGSLLFFRNDGTATNPGFTGFYGDCNPFSNLLQVTNADQEYSAPALIDIDGDGLLEVFSGQFGGQLCFLDQKNNQVVQKKVIPTLSQWSMITLSLLLLSTASILIQQHPVLLKEKTSGTQPALPKNIIFSAIPFYPKLYLKALGFTTIIAFLSAFFSLLIYSTIATIDILGTLTAGPVFAYLLHLLIRDQFTNNDK